MNFNDFKIYLPKYLSSESEKELYSSLKDFPANIDDRIYTNYLKRNSTIYQGDGLKNMLVVNLPSTEKKYVPAMILSNTCDIDPANKRHFPSQIIYAPLVNLDKYAKALQQKIPESRVEGHLNSIRKQLITQIFYLPAIKGTLEASVVFLDRVFNIGNEYVERSSLEKSRIFTLSDYGNYLFVFKLSLHFTRIQDKVDRKSVNI